MNKKKSLVDFSLILKDDLKLMDDLELIKKISKDDIDIDISKDDLDFISKDDLDKKKEKDDLDFISKDDLDKKKEKDKNNLFENQCFECGEVINYTAQYCGKWRCLNSHK